MRASIKKSGQATIEYLLLIVVVITIGYAVYERINENFFANNGFFDRYFTGVQQVFTPGSSGLNLKYKRFRLSR